LFIEDLRVLKGFNEIASLSFFRGRNKNFVWVGFGAISVYTQLSLRIPTLNAILLLRIEYSIVSLWVS